jgi:PAS domain S-box-containing protein
MLSRRLYVAALLVTFTLIAGAVWWIIKHERSRTLAYWEMRENAAADVMNDRVSDWLTNWCADAQVLAASPSIRGALTNLPGGQTDLRPWFRQQITPYLARAAAAYGVRGIYVLNPTGQVIAQSAEAPAFDAAASAVAQTVIRERRLQVDLVGDVPELGRLIITVPIIAVSDPATVQSEPSHEVIGVVTQLLAPTETLFPLLAGERLPSRTGEALLVRREGDEVVFINPLRHRPANSRQLRIPLDTSPLPARLALRGEKRFGEFTDYRGVLVFAATRRIGLTNWGLVHKIDQAEALADFHAVARLEAVVAGLIMLTLAALLGSQWQHQRTQVLREMIAASEARLRLASIVESSDDAIIGNSLDGIITSWNAGAQKIYGYTAEEVIGRPISILGPPDHPDELPAIFDRVKRGERAAHIETVGAGKDGQRIDVSLTISAIAEVQGTVVGASTIARDTTERKRAEETLQRTVAELGRSNAELQQFAYVASHDLQEPLRMVASYVDLLAQRYKGKLDADADEFIAYAVDGATRMRRLINDLLDYSRIGTRGKEFAPTACETVLDDVLANLQETIVTSGAVVTHEPLPTIMGDDMQMTRLLQNLIGNAIKFHGEAPPRVHVAAQRQDAGWLFSVRDNGIGIASQHFERIFVIFQRLHGRAEYPGTGIGLAICKRIVERHGGRIWIESEPGKGSTFFFTIPDARGQ